ncbi:hypothetical protein [Pseudomonas tolaasii]|uniref:hypothetical protein n=1 Tax=Pseudomonas tolaasii TaxID=29442 RepID=UPI00356B75BD
MKSEDHDNALMERVLRSLKTEWIPAVGNRAAQEAQRDISLFLMHRYNWIRPHKFNGGLASARAKKNLMSFSGLVDHYSMGEGIELLEVIRKVIGDCDLMVEVNRAWDLGPSTEAVRLLEPIKP